MKIIRSLIHFITNYLNALASALRSLFTGSNNLIIEDYEYFLSEKSN